MNGTTEGIQPVTDFLPQKPHSEAEDASKPTPVTEPEQSLPGFPSEPRLDAPVASTEAEPPASESRTIGDVNAENFQQNTFLSTSGGNVTEGLPKADATPTNGISSEEFGEGDGTSANLGNQPITPTTLLPGADEDTSPVPPIPQIESLPPQESSSSDQPLPVSSIDQSVSIISSLPTQISPPVEQHPTSDLREVPEPISQESPTALRIKSDKHQEDLARDPELAQGLSEGDDAPIERSLAPPISLEDPLSRPDSGLGMNDSAPITDKMDTSLDQQPTTSAPTETETAPTSAALPSQDSLTISTEQPATPAPTPALPSSTDGPSTADQMIADQTMTEAPAALSELKHEREEDPTDEEPAVKRAKTDTASVEPEFKVPELPKATSTSAPVNGATRTTPEVDDDTARLTQARIKHLNKAIQSAKKVQCSRFFRTPVDYVTMNIPNYPEVVKEPMDLSTIEKKLKAAEYPTAAEFKSDVDLMVTNAIKFNGPDHLVAKEGRDLQNRLVEATSTMPPIEFEEPSRAEKKAQKIKVEPSRAVPARRQSSSNAGAAQSPASATANQTFALTPDGVPLIRRDSNVADGRPKRAIHPPKRRDDIPGGRPKKKKFEWQLKFCREVLNELKKPKHYAYAQFFYYPVDPVALNIPSYHSLIKKPMDLQTVENKLNANEYEKAKDFEEDVRQILKNCFKFNVKGDHVYNCGEQFEKVFNEKWATKDDWLDDHEPASGPVSPGSESEEQEEEEEEQSDSEAERNEKLQQLQKQIEMMSKQMGELANAKKKKKPTPPVPGKKAKKSGGKKEGKSGATLSALSGNKKEKSKTKSKPEKERFVTYNEKQYISMGISSLPDDRMSEALRIIQSNVPSLKNTHETEIELDIDELPNHVLLKLLTFVKRHVPQAPPEPETVSFVSSSTTAPSGKPKKNKPMSKHEQEAQIEELKGRLGRYGEGQISPEPVQSIEQGDSSGDESDSEESEEE